MPDYKAMYYHLTGRMAVAVDVLEATTDILESTTTALVNLAESLKLAQQKTEEMFINSEDNEQRD